MIGTASIYKYRFDIADEFAIHMPKGAKIIHVDVQKGVPCMWAIIDPFADREPRKFRVIGTGHEHSGQLFLMQHIATFQMPPFVWHLFADD